ncbi:hypothetical protein CEUSTIGMA_g5846.t1 [Chlamydomonas eustigma]|uniref:Uncharacterized protein n=1 Tax=Chlamydomonas eustigma TaxID=1157962 RepID=A0A250X5N9_9CHLO|nr:hypothetical protein CEUSTIGMA_g5846.t1 [Chlamydomonas eustigma]|eukprot:GAX78404.1 hypothetical protein CEUSTIGMA_g5846.t1 [Chlamydomonas eustigma]
MQMRVNCKGLGNLVLGAAIHGMLIVLEDKFLMINRLCVRQSTRGVSGQRWSPCSSFGVTGLLTMQRSINLCSFQCYSNRHEGEIQDIVSSGKKPRARGSVNAGVKKKNVLKPKLQPTDTLCWVNKSLVILRDPVRRRFIFVLGLEHSHDDVTHFAQLKAVIAAGAVKAAYFHEPEASRAVEHLELEDLRTKAAQQLNVFTQALRCNASAGVGKFPQSTQFAEEESEVVHPRSTTKGTTLSRLRMPQSYLIRKRRAAKLAEGGEDNRKWSILLKQMRQARIEGVKLSEESVIVQNRDIVEGMGPSVSPYYNLVMPLGPGPLDFTLFLHSNHDSAQQHLERCLKEESSYLEHMSRLEENWQGTSVLDRDWGSVERMNTTTGRSKMVSLSPLGTEPVEGGEGGDATSAESPGSSEGSEDAGRISATSGGLNLRLLTRPVRKDFASEAQNDDDLSAVSDILEDVDKDPLQPESSSTSISDEQVHSSQVQVLTQLQGASSDSADVQRLLDISEDSPEVADRPLEVQQAAEMAFGSDHCSKAQSLQSLRLGSSESTEDESASASSHESAGSAMEDERTQVLTAGSVEQVLSPTAGSWPTIGRTAGSNDTEEQHAVGISSAPVSSSNTEGEGMGAGASAAQKSQTSPQEDVEVGPSKSKVLADGPDAELAALLLGRRPTLSEVEQLCQAFAQVEEVETSLASRGKHLAKLKQVIEGLIKGSGDRKRIVIATPDILVQSSSSKPSSSKRNRRYKLRIPDGISLLANNKLFNRILPLEMSTLDSLGAKGGEASNNESGSLKISEALLSQLRVSPRLHSYVVAKNVLLVVDKECLQSVAQTWDAKERRLMS